MKKLVFIAVCVLGIVFSGFAVNQTGVPQKKEPVKTEVKKEPVKAEAKKEAVKADAKKDVKKAGAKKGMKVEKKEEAKKK